jgi:hypothetical protein
LNQFIQTAVLSEIVTDCLEVIFFVLLFVLSVLVPQQAFFQAAGVFIESGDPCVLGSVLDPPELFIFGPAHGAFIGACMLLGFALACCFV